MARSDGPGFAYSGTELDAMAAAPNYYAAIHSRFAPYLGEHTIEVGAGIGTFSALLADDDRIRRLTLIEPAANNFPRLRDRFAGRRQVSVISGYLRDQVGIRGADALVLVNVLEHIEDDLGFLRDARGVLNPSGKLLIFVPALPVLYGSLDRAFEHHRRYTRRALSERLHAAGFAPRVIEYANLPGALSWFLVGRVLRRETLSLAQVRAYDRWIVPWVMRLEARFAPPFGQSLLVVADPV